MTVVFGGEQRFVGARRMFVLGLHGGGCHVRLACRGLFLRRRSRCVPPVPPLKATLVTVVSVMIVLLYTFVIVTLPKLLTVRL